MITSRILAAGLVLATLAACDRSDPPIEKLERSAEAAIGEVTGETLPQQAAGPFAPRDECSDLAGGAVFLGELRNAVRRRDADALVALTASDVVLDFGGGSGQALLRERLDSKDYFLWDELAALMPLGCAANDEASMTIPWFFAQDFGSGADNSTFEIVTAEDVPLFAGNAPDAEVLATVSWDKVELLVDAPEGVMVRWINPETDQPVEGIIRSGNVLRSLLGYRILAARRNDRWRIVSIVAGD